MSNLILQVDARAMVIDDDGRVLIMREAPSDTYKDGVNAGKYHFPGGRLNPGEDYISGLHREVMEEVGLEVEVGKLVKVVEWRPVIRGQQYHIISVASVCRPKTTDVRLSEEHDEFKWIELGERANHALLPGEVELLEAYVEQLDS